jgi:hypothetical protein
MARILGVSTLAFSSERTSPGSSVSNAWIGSEVKTSSYSQLGIDVLVKELTWGNFDPTQNAAEMSG